MKKRIAIIVTAIMMAMSLTACDEKETSSNDGGSLPVDTSNDKIDTSTSYIESQTPEIPESSNTSSASETSKPVISVDNLPLAPANAVKMDDDLALGEFVINGTTFNVADDLTVNGICERASSRYGAWKNDDKINSTGTVFDRDASYLADTVGFRFRGRRFSDYDGGVDAAYIEATRDGKLIDLWTDYPKEDRAPYEAFNNYKVKAVMCTGGDTVHFVGGLTIDEAPEYYEEMLGKGYEIEGYDPIVDFNYRLSIYKNSTVTMVIEYREYDGYGWRCNSITLIKND